MEKNGKVGRPKALKPKNIQIKITVTEDENERLENISKKFRIKKTELLRIFALGIDEKTPNDIYFHDKSFYPFTNSYQEFIDGMRERRIQRSKYNKL